MKITVAALAAIITAGLASCAYWTPQTDITGQQFSYRPGTGVIESMSRAPMLAAAGGTASPDPAMYRLGIRMDDGRMQYIDTESTDFTRGQRVRLTDERLIEKQ